MINDAIARKLVLLPEGLAESKLQSWRETVEFFERPVDAMIGEHFPNTGYVCDIAKAILKSRQAKLFRAGEKAYDLIISTADQRELKIGEPFLHLDADRGFSLSDMTSMSLMGSLIQLRKIKYSHKNNGQRRRRSNDLIRRQWNDRFTTHVEFIMGRNLRQEKCLRNRIGLTHREKRIPSL